MIWLRFLISAAIVVVAAIKLADYGDIIAHRTKLGGMFIGALLMAGATSLPELAATVSSISQSVPNLAAGNMFGSNIFNMLLLGVFALLNWRARVLRRVAMKHALTASLATVLAGLVTFLLLANIDLKLGWLGADSLFIIIVYLVGVWLIRANDPLSSSQTEPDESFIAGLPSLRKAITGFAIATIVLILVVPQLVSSSNGIATVTGLGAGFVGVVLLAFVTSLPELVSCLAAARFGAYDMAVGNLFGSNLFNMLSIGLADLFYLQGRFLSVIDHDFALAGLIGLLLTGLGLVGNLARVERRFLFVEIDALLLILGYIAGVWLLYTRGIGV